MPIVTVLLSTPPSAEQSQIVAGELLRLTADILRKKPDLTSIAISHIDPAHWYVGGTTLASQDKTSFFIDIRVTDETNTADEKACYVDAVFKTMSAVLGDVHHESYVHVHDVRAAAYGYGGLTQQYRAIAAQLR